MMQGTTTSLADLTVWLLEQIEQDTLAAIAYLHTGNEDAVGELAGWVELGGETVDKAEAHLNRHQPKRVREDGYARRRIVEECAKVLAVTGWEYDDTPNLAEFTLRHLGLKYAGCEGYREEWKP